MPRQYTHIAKARVTPNQLAQIEADAEAYGKSVAGYIRDRLTGKRIRARADDAMLRELRRIGGLLRHQRAEVPEIVAALNMLTERIE